MVWIVKQEDTVFSVCLLPNEEAASIPPPLPLRYFSQVRWIKSLAPGLNGEIMLSVLNGSAVRGRVDSIGISTKTVVAISISPQEQQSRLRGEYVPKTLPTLKTK